MEFVSVQQIVASAKAQLGIYHNNLDNYFKMFAIEAEKEILSRQTISKHHVVGIPVHGHYAEAPKGFYSLVELMGYKEGGGKIVPSFLPSSFYRCERESPNLKGRKTDDPLLSSPLYYGYAENSYGQSNDQFIQEWYPYTFELQNGYFFFSDQCDFDYIDLSYKGFNFDENGELKIPSSHQRAIRAYLAWNYHLENQYATKGQVDMYWREWARAKKDAKGRDAMISTKETEFARNVLESIMSAPRMRY